ncbi:MAG: putative ABC transporter permease [Lachnospiraceae bacterium]|nr:putative ABC transporter permease [Lachnospiraceae bacterium]
MLISKYMCLFFIYSIIGWVYECIFCIVKTRKWENRGFMYGPMCPIYGFGGVAMTIIAGLLPPLSPENVALDVLRIFLIALFGSMILEYGSSWVLEKVFHAIWWDYSDMPFNLNGRISLFSTLGFGVAGPLVTFFVIPPIKSAVDMIPPLLIELMALVFVVFGTVDLTLTVSVLTHFERKIMAIEESINDRMDSLVEDMQRSMDMLQKSALKRVRSFRYPRISANRLLHLGELIKRFR